MRLNIVKDIPGALETPLCVGAQIPSPSRGLGGPASRIRCPLVPGGSAARHTVGRPSGRGRIGFHCIAGDDDIDHSGLTLDAQAQRGV